ncbi:related to JJJ1 |uniref:Related to JJJ1 \|nr:-domain-containing protein [Melanopsichium pennsylvanicum 4]SNX84364.1 related to JJJ1 \
MGASQSSHKAGATGGTAIDADGEPAFVDYYELLKVQETATSDEIRKAYRKLALKHHPDKNPDNVEQANKIFHKLQEAYEILSDDTERAWYDQNRERLMNGEGPDLDDEQVFDAFRSGAAEAPQPTSSSRGLTAKALLRFFDPSLANDFTDGDNGFYATYRRLFERLAQEERIAAPYPGEDTSVPSADAYPSFGYSHTPYSHAKGQEADVHQTPLRDFYNVFINFQSRKSFGWFDKYDLRDAPDRRVKRLMDKENKRSRDAARREYNDAVRSLAAFVRKRDPRYKKFQSELNSTGPGSAADLARRKAEAEKVRLEREARAQSYQAQSWQQPEYHFSDQEDEDEHDYQESQDDGDSASDGEDDHNEATDSNNALNSLDDDNEFDGWDCVACDKLFQSEAAFRNHERSAKHKKAVQKLQREMQDEEDELGLGLDADDIAIDFSLVDMHLDGAKARSKEDANVTAGFSIPSSAIDAAAGKSKKQKKQAKKRRQMEQVAGRTLDEDGFVVQDLNRKSAQAKPKQEVAVDEEAETKEPAPIVHVIDDEDANGSHAGADVCDEVGAGDEESVPTPAQSSSKPSPPTPEPGSTSLKPKNNSEQEDPWGGLKDPHIPVSAFSTTVAPPLPPLSRPTGSFDIFGYGSLIFKPPPYVIAATPCYIKGFVRRFAQHSVDHRGTRSRPGRVVTLVKASDWHPLCKAAKVNEPKSPEGDIVWGVSFTIDPEHAAVVRQYLDYREKNGYSAMHVPLYTKSQEGDEEKEAMVLKNALVYVGLPSNPAFVGPQSLDALAQRIYTCVGPSGSNPEYLLNLASAVRELAPQSVDHHLFSLEKRLLLLQEQDVDPVVLIAHESKEDAASKDSKKVYEEDEGENEEAGARRGKKGKNSKPTGKSKEWCNVCKAGFESRSKLFNHIRETGHALAGDQKHVGSGKKSKRR